MNMKRSIKDYIENTSEEELLDWCVDWTTAIVHDEFNRKEKKFGTLAPYRERAIDKLVNMRVEWHSTGNIEYEVAKRYIAIKCPYCLSLMDYNGVTGRMYVCDRCKSVANITVDISFKPK